MSQITRANIAPGTSNKKGHSRKDTYLIGAMVTNLAHVGMKEEEERGEVDGERRRSICEYDYDHNYNYSYFIHQSIFIIASSP